VRGEETEAALRQVTGRRRLGLAAHTGGQLVRTFLMCCRISSSSAWALRSLGSARFSYSLCRQQGKQQNRGRGKGAGAGQGGRQGSGR
jgi:hypothetical protein